MQRHSLLASMLLLALPAAGTAGPPAAAATTQQVLDDASAHLARIDQDLKLTVAQAGTAREEKDVAKLVCVDEKLGAMKSLAKVARQAHADLVSALAQGDSPGAGVEATKIATARVRVESVRREAERCLGLLPYRADETTSVEVREPADLPGVGPGKGLGVARRTRATEDGSPLLGGDPPPPGAARGP